MNDKVCSHCDGRITDGMDVRWNGGEFHPGCVGEAVLEHRAKQEREEDLEIKEALESFDEFEDLQDDDFDDLEPDEILDKPNIIIPEVVGTNGDNMPIGFPQGGVLVAPRAIIHPPQNGNGLMVHCGAQRISRADLSTLDTPEGTSTFQPIAHSQLVDVVEEALAFRHIRIVDQEFATSPDGMKLFGVLRVNADYEGVGFAIGLRNANDKSMRVGIVSGYRVFCCDNLAFSGDFNPMLQKHSKNLDLIESVSIAIDRIQRQWQPLRMAIDYKRNHFLNEDVARNMIYRLFTDYKLPISLFRTVHKEYFVNPTYEDFSEKTLWSFENAITTAFKKLNPIPRYEQTAKVGKFIADYIQSAN